MITIDLKDRKGITSIDLSIAMIVVLIFTIIMSSISYNVYASSMEAKRTAVAINYAVDIFEHIGALDFEDVIASYDLLDTDSLKDFEYNQVTTNNNIDTITGKIGTYNIEIIIEDLDKNEDSKGDGLIKLITLNINYSISRKNEENLTMQRLKLINEQ